MPWIGIRTFRLHDESTHRNPRRRAAAWCPWGRASPGHRRGRAGTSGRPPSRRRRRGRPASCLQRKRRSRSTTAHTTTSRIDSAIRWRRRARTKRGRAVDVEPGFLHEEGAQVEVAIDGGEVQHVAAVVVRDLPQVHLAGHL